MKHLLTAVFTLLALAAPAQEIVMPQKGVCAHRGDHSRCPENTVPAFVAAVERKVEMIEMDIRYTQDKKLVILHDLTVDRTSNGTGKIADLTFDEVRALDFGIKRGEEFQGTQIPTLDEALAVLPRNIWINLHLGGGKQLALEVAETVVRTGRVHQAFLACGREAQQAVQAQYPQILLCNMQRWTPDKTYAETTLAWNCQFLQPTHMALENGEEMVGYKITSPKTGETVPPLTYAELQMLKKAGVKVNFFHAETAEAAKKLFDAGVDFVLTDNLSALGK